MAGLIFEPHPPNFENQYNFWRCSNNVDFFSFFNFSTGFRFSKVSVECSVHIFSCPWLTIISLFHFQFHTNNFLGLSLIHQRLKILLNHPQLPDCPWWPLRTYLNNWECLGSIHWLLWSEQQIWLTPYKLLDLSLYLLQLMRHSKNSLARKFLQSE